MTTAAKMIIGARTIIGEITTIGVGTTTTRAITTTMTTTGAARTTIERDRYDSMFCHRYDNCGASNNRGASKNRGGQGDSRQYDRRPQNFCQCDERLDDRREPPNNNCSDNRQRPHNVRPNPPRPQEDNERQLVPITPVSTERSDSSVHCFNFQEPKHYVLQIPHKQRGQLPTVNTITAEVQQVTTRSKAKTVEWEEQHEIRKPAKEWVIKANETNV